MHGTARCKANRLSFDIFDFLPNGEKQPPEQRKNGDSRFAVAILLPWLVGLGRDRFTRQNR
jgi:hypothetical protein